MSEHKIPIPSMLYNAAVGGHITNSQQIIDEDYNLEQKDINKETLGVPYNVSNPNGMGKIILKKNDNFKQVIESQTNGNTIFIIKYDFTLTGNVTIPANCILEFDGGVISGNGTNKNTITCNNTSISYKHHCFNGIKLDGTLKEDLLLNAFVHANDCTESSYNTDKAIYVIGDYEIDEPMLVKSNFCIYGDSMLHTRIRLSDSYSGVRTIFLFDSTPGGIGFTSFKDFKVVDTEYVFYRECQSIASSTGSIFISIYNNLYFENIYASVFHIHCYGFSSTKIDNIIVQGQCVRDNKPVMDFNVYYFNYNTISRSNFSGLAVNNLLKIRTDNKGQVNINSVMNCRFEAIYVKDVNPSGTAIGNRNPSFLLDVGSDNMLNGLTFRENYIERIYIGGSDETLMATFVGIEMAPGKICRNIAFYGNHVNNELEHLLYVNGSIVGINVENTIPNNVTNNVYSTGLINDTIIGNNQQKITPIVIQGSAYLQNYNDLNSVGIAKKFNSTNITAGSYKDFTLTDLGLGIYEGDVQISYTSSGETPSDYKVITGKIVNFVTNRYTFIKTFGADDVLSITVEKQTDCTIRVTNISQDLIAVKIGVRLL